MPHRTNIALVPVFGLALAALAGCVTPTRMYTAEELGRAGAACGLALGELAQEEEEPRLLFLMTVERPGQLRCVRQWAERRNLRLVYLENMERVPDAPAN